jgi:hypothetical protein
LEHPRVAPEIERIQTLLAHVDADYQIVRAAVIPTREAQ